MKYICFIWFFIVLGTTVFAEKKIIQFNQLLNPNSIQVEDNRIYITDKASINIYSLKNFKIIKTIGKQGNGPREFRLRPNVFRGGVDITLYSDFILVNSVGKLSFYTKEGEYIKEISTKRSSGKYLSIGANFIGIKSVQDKNGIEYNTFNLYDPQLNKIKEIYRKESWNERKKLDPISFAQWPIIYYYNKKIFIDGQKDRGDLLVFDSKGEALNTIKHKYRKVKVTSSSIKKYKDFFKKSSGYKGFLENYKNIIKFAEYFPAIRGFCISDKKIYVVTYGKINNKWECYIFNESGRFLEKVMIGLIEKSPLHFYPYTVNKNKLYQLKENIDDEGWELHITNIK